MRRAAALLAVLALAAPAFGDQETPPGAIPADAAFAAFTAICLDTAPGFEGAARAMPAHGLDRVAETGTVFHASGTLSAKVAVWEMETGQIRRCSVVFEDPDEATAIALLAARLDAAGIAARLDPPATSRGSVLHRWHVEIGGQAGSVFYMGPSPAFRAAIFAVDFPAD